MSHPPKIRALIALAEGRLSDAGQARLLRHLEHCPGCRKAQNAQLRYEQLRSVALEDECPVLRWDDLEEALDRPAVLPLARRAPLWFGGGLAVAAAAALALLATRPAPEETARVNAPKAAPISAAGPRLGQLSLISGSVEVADAHGVFAPAALHAELHVGMRIRTGEDSEAHATLADGTSIALDAQSLLALSVLDGRHVALGLATGNVRSSVSHLAADESYEVRTADGYTARVRGTHFTVSHGDAETRVGVTEGVVDVLSGDELLQQLHAGESFAAHAAPDAPSFVEPLAPELAENELGGLVLPRLPQARSYVVYDHTFPAREGLALRAPMGTLLLGLIDQRGAHKTVPIQITSRLTQISAARLLALLGGARDKPQELGPDTVRPVVRNGIVALRRCYERSLIKQPDLSAKLLLRMQVTPEGRVGQTLIVEQRRGHTEGLPPELSACVNKAVRTWRFPPPGGTSSVDLEVPIRLKSMEPLGK